MLTELVIYGAVGLGLGLWLPLLAVMVMRVISVFIIELFQIIASTGPGANR
jgi:hypothetical protein